MRSVSRRSGWAVFAAGVVVVASPADNAIIDNSLGPACGFPAPFTGFARGTDAATVSRSRGSAPTRLVAQAGRGDFTLGNLRLEVVGRSGVVRVADLGSVPAVGQELPIVVGDEADDGSPITPGRYAVIVSADVSGTDSCGKQAWQRIDTTAGFLVVR